MATSTGLSTVALKVSGTAVDPTIRPAASEPKSIATARTSLIFTGSLRQRSRGFRWRPLVRRQRAVLFAESHRAWKPDQASQSAQHLFRKHCRSSPTEPEHARIAHPAPPWTLAHEIGRAGRSPSGAKSGCCAVGWIHRAQRAYGLALSDVKPFICERAPSYNKTTRMIGGTATKK